MSVGLGGLPVLGSKMPLHFCRKAKAAAWHGPNSNSTGTLWHCAVNQKWLWRPVRVHCSFAAVVTNVDDH